MNNYDSEMCRIASFKHWPPNCAPVSAYGLARTGFFYTGTGDEVCCYRCRCVVRDWKEGDVPVERHKSASPNCPLVTSCVPSTSESLSIHSIASPTDEVPSRQNLGLYNLVSTKPNRVEFPELRQAQAFAPTSLMMETQVVGSSRNDDSRAVGSSRNDDSRAAGPSRNDDFHLKTESVRLRTFGKWHVPYVSPSALAKAGFYSLNLADCVKCAFCNGILKQWEPGDVPSQEHKRHYPHCPFVRGHDVGNIPLPKPSNQNAPPCYDRLPDPALLPVNFEAGFSDSQERLKSFDNVRLPKGQTGKELVDAGFFYVGPGDSVKCFQCGGVLKKWSSRDNPWTEHAKWFPHCQYVIREKGVSFIENVQRSEDLKTETAPPLPPPPAMPMETSNEDETSEKWTESTELEESTEDLTSVKMLYFRGDEQHRASSSLPAGAGVKPTVVVGSSKTPSLPPMNTTQGVEDEKLKDENERLKDALLCKICMDEMANTVFLPCGHLLSCENCAPAVHECPVCRGEIKGTLKIYIS